MLRTQPDTAIAAYGFITRGAALANPAGANCTLNCGRYRASSVYQIDVAAGGADWYIPFAQGQARYCDVPPGQANGTLVVTFPMNGCALEVRDVGGANRFYHDSDGNSLPALTVGAPKIRVTYAQYAGPDNTTHERSLRYFGPDKDNTGGYEHNIFCVKVGANWQVYSSAVIRLNQDAFQIKDRVPFHVGTFAD